MIGFNYIIDGFFNVLSFDKDAWLRFLIVLGVCFYFIGMPTGISLLLALLIAGLDK